MTTNTIRKKLTNYIQEADPKKLKAIYTLVEQDVEQQTEDEIDDELLAELDKRSAEMIAGTVKTYTWEEIKNDALERIKNKQHQNA